MSVVTRTAQGSGFRISRCSWQRRRWLRYRLLPQRNWFSVCGTLLMVGNLAHHVNPYAFSTTTLCVIAECRWPSLGHSFLQLFLSKCCLCLVVTISRSLFCAIRARPPPPPPPLLLPHAKVCRCVPNIHILDVYCRRATASPPRHNRRKGQSQDAAAAAALVSAHLVSFHFMADSDLQAALHQSRVFDLNQVRQRWPSRVSPAPTRPSQPETIDFHAISRRLQARNLGDFTPLSYAKHSVCFCSSAPDPPVMQCRLTPTCFRITPSARANRRPSGVRALPPHFQRHVYSERQAPPPTSSCGWLTTCSAHRSGSDGQQNVQHVDC